MYIHTLRCIIYRAGEAAASALNLIAMAHTLEHLSVLHPHVYLTGRGEAMHTKSGHYLITPVMSVSNFLPSAKVVLRLHDTVWCTVRSTSSYMYYFIAIYVHSQVQQGFKCATWSIYNILNAQKPGRIKMKIHTPRMEEQMIEWKNIIFYRQK